MKKIGILLIGLSFLLVGCDLENVLNDFLTDGTISISNPKNNDEFGTREIAVKGSFEYDGDRDDDKEDDYDTKSHEFFYVEIEVNGTRVSTVDSSDEEINFNETVTLDEGKNTITVIGFYLDEEIVEEDITVYCDTIAPDITITTASNSKINTSVYRIIGVVPFDDTARLEYKTELTMQDSISVDEKSDYTTLSFDEYGNWEISLNNSSTVEDNQTTVVSPTLPNNGDSMVVYIRATDSVGNTTAKSILMKLFKTP